MVNAYSTKLDLYNIMMQKICTPGMVILILQNFHPATIFTYPSYFHIHVLNPSMLYQHFHAFILTTISKPYLLFP